MAKAAEETVALRRTPYRHGPQGPHLRTAGSFRSPVRPRLGNHAPPGVRQDFEKGSAAGESTLVYVVVGDATNPTIIHDVGRGHRVAPIHADFYKVRWTRDQANVPWYS